MQIKPTNSKFPKFPEWPTDALTEAEAREWLRKWDEARAASFFAQLAEATIRSQSQGASTSARAFTPRFHLTMKSGNVKTGQIPVSTSSNTTCPDACPLKSRGCYASAGGPLALHWRKVSEEGRGDDWQTFVARISALPAGQLFRHNQAGDLPGENNSVDVSMLAQLVDASEGKRGWTYTHKPVTGDSNEATCNRAAVRQANERGFTVNLSADNLAEADELKAADCGPVVVVLPVGSPLAMSTPAGHKVIVCPAQRPGSAATCATCGLCQRQRSVIVGFLAHGTQAKAASAIAAN